LLAAAYLLRLAPLADVVTPPLLLTNPRLEALLRPLGTPAVDHPASPSNHSIATWEFFRHLVSPAVDPLNERTVAALDDCLRDRADEIDAMRFACERLAEQPGEVSPADVPRRVETHIRRHVAEDLAELLRLDERAKGEYVASLLSDRATWAGLLTAGAAATLTNRQRSPVGARPRRRRSPSRA
jgi:hypothetical protein